MYSLASHQDYVIVKQKRLRHYNSTKQSTHLGHFRKKDFSENTLNGRVVTIVHECVSFTYNVQMRSVHSYS